MFETVRILVVDDEESILKTVKRALEIEGYEVAATTSPVEALEKVKTGRYLVVISDIVMPEMSGIDLLRAVKQYNGMVQVIMMTGYVTLSNVLDCLRRGASDCVFKPFNDISEISQCVEEAVGKLKHWGEILKRLEKLR